MASVSSVSIPKSDRTTTRRVSLHHLAVDVDCGAASPVGDHVASVAGHNGGIARDAIAVKCRLNQAALAHPVLAFAEHQAIAEEPAAVPRGTVLDEIGGVANQHIVDIVGIAQKVDVIPKETVVEDAAVFGGPAAIDAEGVAAG